VTGDRNRRAGGPEERAVALQPPLHLHLISKVCPLPPSSPDVHFGKPKPRRAELLNFTEKDLILLTGTGAKGASLAAAQAHALGRGKPASSSLEVLTQRMFLSCWPVAINPPDSQDAPITS
jgi:hypothetical protein